ncbi:MAG: exo-alpha-sialidase, partial [Clostridia bacterium]|nr:exo-alpha-sialidase [Clostridia bacterium]
MNSKKEFVCRHLPTVNCHASTVLPLENGSVIIAWFGGTKEGNSDVNIWYSIRRGGEFSRPKEISVSADIPHWNPVLFELPGGKIALYFKVGKKIKKWKTYVCYSDDRAETFTKPVELIKGDKSGGRGPVKNKCLVLSNGRILAPASGEKHGWKCFIDISDDKGATWKRSKYVKTESVFPLFNKENGFSSNRIKMIQPTLWESEPGKVHMFTRTSAGRIYRSDSEDCGETWCEAYSTDLPNNNSGIDLVRITDGRLFLVSNPVCENWGERSPLTIQVSSDNGKTFSEFFVLEDEQKDSEFSYPAITHRNGK